MNIVILGSPGSGKGTQAELLAKKLKLFRIQTGDLSRKLSEDNPRIAKIVNSGKLIPQEEMTMYVLDYLKNRKGEFMNILFEGFPRFISQYEALENFLKSKGDDIDAVISLEITKAEAVKRISSRRICPKCATVYNLLTNPPEKTGSCKCGGKLVQRKDDKPKSIETRFEYYKQNTKKLINFLDGKNKLIKIDGERPIEDIFEDILEKLKKKGLI